MNEERPRPIRRSTTPDHTSTVNNERIVFTAADRVVKRKRKNVNHGRQFVDDKNRAIIELVTAYGWLSRFQIAEYFGLPPATVHRRAHKLAALGLLNQDSRGTSGEVLYLATRAGMRFVGMAGFKLTTPTPQLMNHTEGLFAAGLRFGESPLRHGIVITEREIDAAVTSGTLSPRIQRLAPWAQSQFEGRFASWRPVADPISGSGKGFKRPDMLLIREGLLPTVVELEITQKSTIQQYVRILEAYDRAQKAGDFANPIIYVTVEVAGNHNDIKKALETALASANHIHKMKVEFLVFNISQGHWNPRSAQNGWFRKGTRA